MQINRCGTRYPMELKKRIIEESIRTPFSITHVAKNYGINANILFYWRNQLGIMKDGKCGRISTKPSNNGKLNSLKEYFANTTKKDSIIKVDRNGNVTIDGPYRVVVKSPTIVQNQTIESKKIPAPPSDPTAILLQHRIEELERMLGQKTFLLEKYISKINDLIKKGIFDGHI